LQRFALSERISCATELSHSSDAPLKNANAGPQHGSEEAPLPAISIDTHGHFVDLKAEVSRTPAELIISSTWSDHPSNDNARRQANV
jgi:hypothetical protein